MKETGIRSYRKRRKAKKVKVRQIDRKTDRLRNVVYLDIIYVKISI